MTTQVALWLLALTLVLLVAGVVVYDQGRSRSRLASRRARLAVGSQRIPLWRRVAHAAVMRLPFGPSVEERLRRAGIDGLLAGDAVLGLLVLVAAVAFVASRLVAPVATVALVIATVLAANRYLDRRVRQRNEKFADQLPDIARVISNAAGAGMSIYNALALTAREMEEPAHSLLAHAVRQMDVGQTLAGAMEDLQARAPSREMAVLVSTLLIQQRAGGDVIEALREMSVNLEARRDLKREVDTTMAGVRFTAFAVMGLGIGMLFLVESINSGTLRRLTSEPLGLMVLTVSFALYALGYAAIRRLSQLDL